MPVAALAAAAVVVIVAVVVVVVAAAAAVIVVVMVVVEKRFSLTQPWVVLFSDLGIYQSPGRTRRRTCAVPRKALSSAAQPH